MITVSFLKVVYTLKYPSNACLSYLDNGLSVLPVAKTGVFTNKTKLSYCA